MWILIVLQLLVIVILALLLIVGPILMIAGKARDNKKYLRLGFKLFLIPIVIAGAALIYYLVWETFAVKPTSEDLIGNYKLTTASAAKYGNADLHFYENGDFETSKVFNQVLCEKGKYKLYDDEVWFRCDSHSSAAKIVRGFTDFQIKFKNGSSDSSDDLTFEKVDE